MKRLTFVIIMIFVMRMLIVNNLICYENVFHKSCNSNPVILKDSTKINKSGNATLPFAIGVASILYLLNPVVLYENDKIALGITKELSVGFGYFGQHRIGIEYSFIFRENQKSHLRIGYKYDLLLRTGLQPSNMFQTTSVLSFGASYFKSWLHYGLSPEVAFGYSIRNHKILFFPNIKIRYTFIVSSGKSNIFDISTGIIIGIANPFIDLKIRNNHLN